MAITVVFAAIFALADFRNWTTGKTIAVLGFMTGMSWIVLSSYLAITSDLALISRDALYIVVAICFATGVIMGGNGVYHWSEVMTKEKEQ